MCTQTYVLPIAYADAEVPQKCQPLATPYKTNTANSWQQCWPTPPLADPRAAPLPPPPRHQSLPGLVP